MTALGWREAMTTALYGPDGFFRHGAGPAGHFRTSVHAAAEFVAAIVRLLELLDEALGRPAQLDVVDVGAGRGELLGKLLDGAPRELAQRLRLTAVEIAPRPAALPDSIAWRTTLPTRITGLLVATEWLDNVPLDVVEVDAAGVPRRVRVDPRTGAESLGDEVDAADEFWLARWWPLDGGLPGTRAEIGWTRDAAWAEAVAAVARGCALAVDYGHLRGERPPYGTLTGYRRGRQVPPVPDGSCDVTAHVAIDAVAEAGGAPYTVVSQRDALRALGVHGARPPLAQATTDPAGYLRALAAASSATELTDPAGLGGHWWLSHRIGVDVTLPSHGTMLE